MTNQTTDNASPASDLVRAEKILFRSLNAVLEPLARAGLLGAPGPWWAGPVVLETSGRASGRTINVPVLAAGFGDLLVVSTLRGDRSQWMQNLAARPQVRYWSGGRMHQATAFCLPPGRVALDQDDAPPHVLAVIAALVPAAAALGLSLAVLCPRRTAGAEGGSAERAASPR
jgi:hypothetical protein